ncbi:MAG: gamma-glutamylcyclotransferase family protein [Christensenellaceae bacterium]|nr:gamma-glutamylcyclotransferase family protein [Christensenellaceae bacterium]
MKYIAYGSNMVKDQMAYRCPDAKLIGTGYIERARLEFYLHATVERSRIKGARVPVAVWEISDADEQRLDRYEGFPNYYIKEEWPVTMADGSEIKGMIYLMNQLRISPPTRDYYQGILCAYQELGLGSEIKRVLLPALCRSLRRKGR